MTRRTFLLSLLGMLGLGVAGAAWANAALETTRVEVASPRLPAAFDGFRVAHVSDLHNAQFGPENRSLLQAIRAARPDLVAVTGDLVDCHRADMDVAVRFVRRARAIAPVYCVSGNHEMVLSARDPDLYARYEARLEGAGACVLRGASVVVERAGERIVLAGVDDPNRYASPSSPAAQRGSMRLQLAGLETDPSAFVLLLTHRPEQFSAYCDAGIDLALAGHAHGGQFRLPFVGGLLAPGQGWFPRYDAGLFTQGSCNMVVSRGLGNSSFPFRLNNRPEVVLVDLARGV